jgi:hypothetical protein
VLVSWDGAGAPGGASPRPEPGAGSAGPGAAQRRRLIIITANFASAARRARRAYGLHGGPLTARQVVSPADGMRRRGL